MKLPIVFFILAFLILGFQNCSDIGEIGLKSGSNSESSTADNGTGYGGKIGGTFYHYIPDYKCENQYSAFSKIEYYPSSNSIYYQSQENQCLSIDQQLSNSKLDFGNLQNKVLGYEEKIFELGNKNISTIPQKIVEIWCVDQWENPSLEILSYYDLKNKKAESEFYFPNSVKQTETNPARITSVQSVKLTSNAFDLIIDKSNKGLKPGTFIGQLNRLSFSSRDQKLQCRLGGYLDARLWPAKVINYENYVQAEWDPSVRKFYLSEGLSGLAPLAVNRLERISAIDGTKEILVENVTEANGVAKFQFDSLRKNIFLKAQLTGDKAYQLYHKDLSNMTSPLRLLNSKLVDFAQSIDNFFNISPQSDKIYYLDGSQEIGSDIESWLKMVDLKTGNITQINQDIFAADEEVRYFEVSYKYNKVIYSVGFVTIDLWVSDLQGKGRHKWDLSEVLGSEYKLSFGIKMNSQWQFKNDKYLALVATNSPQISKFLFIVLDLESEKVIFSKKLSEHAILFTNNDLPVIEVYSGVRTSDQIPSILFYNIENNSLGSVLETMNYFKNSLNASYMNYAKNQLSNLQNLLCSYEENLLIRIPLSNKKTLVLANSTVNNYNIYLYDSSENSCQLINKLALSQESVTYLKKNSSISLSVQPQIASISEDEKNILLNINGRIYLIPSEQLPPIEVYTALNDTPTINELGFINNEKVFFRGSLIKNYWNQIFIWDIPKLRH